MLGSKLLFLFGDQSYGTLVPSGTAITLYRDFVNDKQLNGPVSEYRIGPNINFVRNSAATYFDSNSAIVLAPVNAPRFDYSSVGEYKGLLIEQQSTNLIPYSESFTSWTGPVSSFRVNLSGNITSVQAPNNTYTATLMTNTTATDFHILSWDGTPALTETQPLSDAEFYTRSIFVKKRDARYVVCSVAPEPSATAGGGIPDFETYSNIFDLDTGLFVENSILDVYAIPLKNGWYRLGFGRSSPNFNTNRFTIGISSGPTFFSTRFTGDISSLSGVYIWGAQTEKGMYPTSYIPSAGASTTRAADNASIFGSRFTQMYSTTASTYMTVASRLAQEDNNTLVSFINNIGTKYWTVNTGVSAARYTLSVATSAGSLSSVTTDQDMLHFDETNAVNINLNFIKTIVSLSANDFSIYPSSSTRVTLTGGSLPTIPNRIDRIQIGRFENQNYLNGHIRTLGYWPARLLDSQIINL